MSDSLQENDVVKAEKTTNRTSVVRPLRKGRGNRRPDLSRVESITRDSLVPVHSITRVADSASSSKNVKRARKILEDYVKRVGAGDPSVVSAESSKLLVNLPALYCKTDSDNPLTDESMGALVQGLRFIYDEAGHRGNWSADISRGTAQGNPLTNNPDITQLRSAHRVKLARIGRAKTRPRPLQVGQILEHARQFWLGSGKLFDYRDVLLHAILVIGLNQGLRYDEIHKISIGSLSVVPGVSGEGSIYFSLTQATKGSTASRNYVIREWPGDTDLRLSVAMDPFIALLTWISIRGNRPGFLFCNVNRNNMIQTDKPWSVSNFQDFFRARLRLCGVGDEDTAWYTGHSIKRGTVQLYRSLGVRDEQVREWIQMTGPNAYANYTAAYNDCQAIQLPRFASWEPHLQHASMMRAELLQRFLALR